MLYYVVLNGDTLEFQQTKPTMESYVQVSESAIFGYRKPPPWNQYRNFVKKVCFLDKIMPVSTRGWFYRFSELEDFDKTNLYLDRTTDMSWMFEFCTSLQTIDLSDMNVSNVKNFSEIFAGCKNLQSVNLSGWDTRNAGIFKMMFYDCTHLSKLDISNLSMESVKNLSFLCSQCQELKEIRFPKTPMRNIAVQGMFEECISLRKLNLPDFEMIDMEWVINLMKDCNSLAEIQIIMDNLS